MSSVTVVVSSITYAIRGQQILERAGIKAHVDRDLEAYGKYGCGYCIVMAKDGHRGVELLQQKKIKIKEILIKEPAPVNNRGKR